MWSLTIENDTLARIGTSCLQQLLENNAAKLSITKWERVVRALVNLFKLTTPHQLFDDSLRIEMDEPDADNTGTLGGSCQCCFQQSADPPGPILLPAPLSPVIASNGPDDAISTAVGRRRIFKQIIVKCVLQLLLIETVRDLLENPQVCGDIPPELLLRLFDELEHSYQFARSFNEDKDLRTGLWKVGT